MRLKGRCQYIIRTNNGMTMKKRRCKNSCRMGLCHVHWKFGNTVVYDGTEYGICCFCNNLCNVCSQCCGSCIRKLA